MAASRVDPPCRAPLPRPSTASMPADAAALDLLERYELLVPGTRLMTRYLSLQPIYAHHPLRRLLLGSPSS